MTITEKEIAFYLSLTTLLSGLVTFVARALLKSNCVDFKCYGLECHRDITHNIQELDIELK